MGLALVFSEPLANDSGDENTFYSLKIGHRFSFHESIVRSVPGHWLLSGLRVCSGICPLHAGDLSFSNADDRATMR